MPVAGPPPPSQAPQTEATQTQAPQGLASVRAVVNIAAGGVGPDAALRLAEIAAEFGLELSLIHI